VEQWNSFIDFIANRSGFDHHTTLRAASFGVCYLPRSVLRDFICHPDTQHDKPEYHKPTPEYRREEVEKRLERLRMTVAQRYEAERLDRERRLADERAYRWRKEQSLYKEVRQMKDDLKVINAAISATKTALKEAYQ
jgi:hypothetical protein